MFRLSNRDYVSDPKALDDLLNKTAQEGEYVIARPSQPAALKAVKTNVYVGKYSDGTRFLVSGNTFQDVLKVTGLNQKDLSVKCIRFPNGGRNDIEGNYEPDICTINGKYLTSQQYDVQSMDVFMHKDGSINVRYNIGDPYSNENLSSIHEES